MKTKMKTLSALLFACLFLCGNAAKAGIALATVVTSAPTQLPGGPVQIDFYARHDGAGLNSFAAYGFTVTLVGPGISGTSALNAALTNTTTASAAASNWTNIITAAPSGGGNTFTFSGAGDPVSLANPPGTFPYPISVSSAVGANPATLIGRISFNASQAGTYTINTATAPVFNLGQYENRSGFVEVGFGNAFSNASVNFGSAQFTITAVPEPSALALCGLTGLAIGFRYRRNKKLAAKTASV